MFIFLDKGDKLRVVILVSLVYIFYLCCLVIYYYSFIIYNFLCVVYNVYL